MSIFYATALAKALREALVSITPNPYWISKAELPESLRNPPAPTAPRASEFSADVRQNFHALHMRCLGLITAVDAYAQAWYQFEGLQHPSYVPKKSLSEVIDKIKEDNGKILLGLHDLLRYSLRQNGRVHVALRNNDKLTDIHLSRIKYATSIAQLLLDVSKHAETYGNGSGFRFDAPIIAERQRQIDVVRQLDEARLTLQQHEAQSGLRHKESPYHDNDLFDHIALTDSPLPFAAFVSRHFELADTSSRTPEIGSGPRTHRYVNVAEGTHHISELLTAIRGDIDGNNAHLIGKLEDLRQSHDELTRKARDLVLEMATTPSAHHRSYGTTTVESGATAILGDIVHNYIFGESSNGAGIFGQSMQNEQNRYPARTGGTAPNSPFSSASGENFSAGPQVFNSQAHPQGVPPPQTAGNPVSGQSRAQPSSAFEVRRDLTGNCSSTNPFRQDRSSPNDQASHPRNTYPNHIVEYESSRVPYTAFPSCVASEKGGLDISSVYDSSSSKAAVLKQDPVDPDHKLRADEAAPPPYTFSHHSDVEPQPDRKPTIMTPGSPLTSQQYPSGHNPRSLHVRSPTQTIRRRPVGSSTVTSTAGKS